MCSPVSEVLLKISEPDVGKDRPTIVQSVVFNLPELWILFASFIVELLPKSYNLGPTGLRSAQLCVLYATVKSLSLAISLLSKFE